MKFCYRISLLLSLLCFALQAQATHIVGGEFELVHMEGDRYTLSLILYSDNIYGDAAAIDPYATIHIWQKSGNFRIRSLTLPKVSHTQIPYTNPDCTIPQLSTSKVVYTSEIILDPGTFSHEGGYYINYERCCRNGVINNIRRPGEVGQAFYLEFPPVVKNGAPFINSSPSLFPPLSDFARLGYPFYFDFRGTDADGDSLVYSLVTPLAGSSSQDPGNVIPPPRPAPYQQVEWAAGYSREEMIPGTPPLRINSEGFLRLTPSQTGLFVFSVLADEYRDGEKIGEVRRDFQLLVYDYEGSDEPPVLEAQKPGNGQFYQETLLLTDSDFTDFENNRCLSLRVRDEDVNNGDTLTNGFEALQFKVRPVNFSGHSTEEYLSVSQGSVDKDNSTFTLELCLPLCPPLYDQPYIFDVIAYDDACALPLSDTIRVTVDLSSGNLNQKPSTRISPSDRELFKKLGDPINIAVSGSDLDGDRISLRAVGDGFNLEEYGMTFTNKQGQGPLQSQFSWTPNCNNVNLYAKNAFTLFFITGDEDICNDPRADTLAVTLGITPPANAPPSLEIPGLESYLQEAYFIGDTSLSFTLKGLDPDQGDTLSLRLDSLASSAGTLTYNWQDRRASGGEVTGVLSLQADCGVFKDGMTENTIKFYFSVADDPCVTQKRDTLSLQVTFKEKTISLEETHFPNVFTPNGDGINDVFKIENLPKDACYNYFQDIVVLNRWGKVLFQSSNRTFEWDGGDYPAATYFYQVNYTGMQHRSPLTLIRGNIVAPGAQ